MKRRTFSESEALKLFILAVGQNVKQRLEFLERECGIPKSTLAYYSNLMKFKDKLLWTMEEFYENGYIISDPSNIKKYVDIIETYRSGIPLMGRKNSTLEKLEEDIAKEKEKEFREREKRLSSKSDVEQILSTIRTGELQNITRTNSPNQILRDVNEKYEEIVEQTGKVPYLFEIAMELGIDEEDLIDRINKAKIAQSIYIVKTRLPELINSMINMSIDGSYKHTEILMDILQYMQNSDEDSNGTIEIPMFNAMEDPEPVEEIPIDDLLKNRKELNEEDEGEDTLFGEIDV